MRKPKNFSKIILLCCSIAITLLLLNVSLVVYRNITTEREDFWKKRIELAKGLGIPFDDRPKVQVIDALRSQGIEVYPVIYPKFLLESVPDRKFLPLGGISNTMGIFDNEGGTYELFTTDEHGFHNPPGSWSKQPDILIVGDNYAMGAGVREGADLRSQLAAYGNHVITLGMGHNGPELELAGLMEYGRYLKPKIVLWVYYEYNDLMDLAKNHKFPIIQKYLRDDFSQDLIHRQNEIDQEVLGFYEEVRRVGETPIPHRDIFYYLSKVKSLITLYELRKMVNFTGQQDQSNILPVFEIVLQKAKNLSSEWGGQIYFVYLPWYSRYSHKTPDWISSRSQVLALARKLGFPVIDFLETLQHHGDPLDFYILRMNGHYTENGNKLLADTIMNSLPKEALAHSQKQ